jgi:hypothetical protein
MYCSLQIILTYTPLKYISIINQHDALFILTLLSYHASTCFGPICSPSSGGSKCICAKWYLFFSKSFVGRQAGLQVIFQRQSGWELMLTSHLNTGLRLRTSGAITYSPSMPSCFNGVGEIYLTVTCFKAKLQGSYNTCKCIAVYKLL